MKRLLVPFVFAFLLFSSLASAERSHQSDLDAYRVVLKSQREATNKLNSATLKYVRSEANCAAPLIIEARQQSYEGLAAYTLSLYSAVARTVQSYLPTTKRIIRNLNQVRKNSSNPIMKKSLWLHMNELKAFLRMPSKSVCSTLQIWRENDYVGLNQIVNTVYGKRVVQKAINDIYTLGAYFYLSEFQIQKVLGQNRTKRFTRLIFWKSEDVWKKTYLSWGKR